MSPEGAPIPVTAATLRLDADNLIELTEFRLDEPQPAPTASRRTRHRCAA